MLQYDFDQSVGYWLMTTWQLYQKAFNEELAPQGITFRQCQVLGYLALDGTLSQCQLAERMKIEPPTLVRILDRMERDGWIERVACCEDRRRKQIRPTEAAEPVWSKIVACGRRVRARATQGLSPRQQQTLHKLLLRVQKNLSAESTLPELVER
ncbi:MAG: MarR family transcriptional regulator [Pirellulaceae bacterium]